MILSPPLLTPPKQQPRVVLNSPAGLDGPLGLDVLDELYAGVKQIHMHCNSTYIRLNMRIRTGMLRWRTTSTSHCSSREWLPGTTGDATIQPFVQTLAGRILEG